MRRRIRPCLVGLAVAGILTAASGSASADDFSVSEPSFRIVMPTFTIAEASYQIECPLTLEGRTSRTIDNFRSEIQFFITAALGSSCAEDAWVLSGLPPASGTYNSFTGTLPNITSLVIHLTGLPIEYEPGVIFNCLIVPDLDQPLKVHFARDVRTGVITDATFNDDTRIEQDGAVCPGTVEFRGTGAMHMGGTTRTGVVINPI